MANPVKDKLSRGEEVFGCFVRAVQPEVAEVLVFAGFDFVVVDDEHAMADERSIAATVRSIEAASGTAFVRSRTSTEAEAGRLLETGAIGIHLPQVDGPELARQALAAVRYPPAGARGLATSRRGGYGLTMSLKEYVERANSELLVIAQIESVQAIREVAEIASLPGLNVLFVGLTDLTADLGIPGDYYNPRVTEALARVGQVSERAGIVLGVPVTDSDMLQRMREFGARYFVANDLRLLGTAAQSFLATCKAL